MYSTIKVASTDIQLKSLSTCVACVQTDCETARSDVTSGVATERIIHDATMECASAEEPEEEPEQVL
jgi:uncharacterized UBP type Zn finger protein